MAESAAAAVARREIALDFHDGHLRAASSRPRDRAERKEKRRRRHLSDKLLRVAPVRVIVLRGGGRDGITHARAGVGNDAQRRGRGGRALTGFPPAVPSGRSMAGRTMRASGLATRRSDAIPPRASRRRPSKDFAATTGLYFSA